MGKTSIEWTDHSWPVVNGCRRVSPGCENCYAERLTATRLSRTPKYKGLAVMKAPPPKVLRRDRADGGVELRAHQAPGRPRWTGEARLWEPHLDMPLRLRKPSRIFVCDMGDLFYEGVSNEDIATIFGVMAACPQHTFQVLTKRPERARAWFDWIATLTREENEQQEKEDGEPLTEEEAFTPSDTSMSHMRNVIADRFCDLGMNEGDPRPPWPLPNVWLGVSVEDQQRADERIPILLDTPAAIRFVSAEPLLGPVSLNPADLGCVGHLAETFGNPLINWVIVGGESGPGARPMDLSWVYRLVFQCAGAGAACFVKQLGARPAAFMTQGGQYVPITYQDRKGSDPAEWPEGLRVREFPNERLNARRQVDPATGAVSPGAVRFEGLIGHRRAYTSPPGSAIDAEKQEEGSHSTASEPVEKLPIVP